MSAQRPSISGDIRTTHSPRIDLRGVRPLPPGMPGRKHVPGVVRPGTVPLAPVRSVSALPHQSLDRAPSKAVPDPVQSKKAPVQRTQRSPVRIWNIAQYPLIALVALSAAASSTIGQILVAVYAALAVVLKQTSQLTFGLALLLLISIPIFQALGQPGIAGNAAIYVFELLVVGTIQAILELKQTA